jgi:hypothetical protein
MKGQLVFEFVVATLFFLAIVMYTLNYLSSTVFLYANDYNMNTMESKVWQVSEVLVREQGDWSGSPPAFLGLANQWPEMNETKIWDFGTFCLNDELGVMDLLNVDHSVHGIKIEINKTVSGVDQNMIECGVLPRGLPNTKITRYGISELDGNLVKVRVWYW